MDRRLRWTMAAACGLAMAAGVARAGPLEPALVGGKAKFVIHVDVERARTTAVGKRILDRIVEEPNYAEFERMMVDAAGFMPASDVDALTIWGEAHGREPKSVLVVRCRMDDRRLRSALALADEFKSEAHGNHELLSWRDEKKGTRVHASILNASTILMSGDADTLRRGLDVADEPAQSLAADPKALPSPADADAWAFLSVVNVAQTPDAPANPVLSQLATAVVEIGQSADGKSVARATATTTRPEQAQRLLRFATGMKAMAEMTITSTKPADLGDPPESFAGELLGATTIAAGADGAVVATMALPSDRATLLVDAVADRIPAAARAATAATKKIK